MKAKRFKIFSLFKILLCAFFFLFLFFPFIKMLSNITYEDIVNIFNSQLFFIAIKNSLLIAVITTVISVALGLTLAFSLQRSRIKFKKILSILFIIPMLIPSISHSMGLIVLFGTNGIISNLLNFSNTIYGIEGIIIGSVFYTYPVAFLMFNDVLKYQDFAPYEAAKVLGIPKHKVTTSITFPFLSKTLIAAIFSVFTLTITDYGIPLLIGGKTTTLAVMMYQEVLGQLDFGKGSVIGLVLLIPATLTFLYNLFSKKQKNVNFITQKFITNTNIIRDLCAYLISAVASLSVILLILSFILVGFTTKYPTNLTPTLNNITKMFVIQGNSYLFNSFLIAFFVAIIGSFTAFVTAYLTTHTTSKTSTILHLFSITTLAIPGLVLGLSYSMTFTHSFIYGTLAILILVNILHFFASPYQIMYNCFNKLNPDLENVGKTLGVKQKNIILNVILPLSKSSVFEIFSYFFVNSMITISAVSFLATASTKPLSLMIGQFEAQMLYECAAIVSLIILISNLSIKVLVFTINKKLNIKST